MALGEDFELGLNYAPQPVDVFRLHWPVGAHAGMQRSVSSLFDAATGTYVPTTMNQHPFCSGQSFLK